MFLIALICYVASKPKDIEQKTATGRKLFAKQIRRGSKTSQRNLRREMSSQEKKKEIENFFRSLRRKKELPLIKYSHGAVLDEANYNMFYSFINNAKKSLDILSWRIDEKLLSELLWFHKDKNIGVRVITKNRINKGYLKEFKNLCHGMNLGLLHRNKVHAKIIIKDQKEIALGSSNFTEASMSESGHFLDCNIITDDTSTVKSIIDLFNSLYHNKDYTKSIKNSRLMYSRNHKNYLPFSLKSYFEHESEEIVLLFSCNMADKRIVDRIIEWNSTTPITLYIGDRWGTTHISRTNLDSMNWLYDTSMNNYKNLKVVPIKKDIHAKLYLFKNQKKAFVSSQNLTVESWQSLLEAGIISNDTRDVKYLYDSIRSFKKSTLVKIENTDLEETFQPESEFSGSKSEKLMGIPWELPESNPKWKIPRIKNQSYYNLLKYKPKEKKDVSLEGAGKREGSDKISKSTLIKDLESKHLSRKSITGLYSKPTRYILTGKTTSEKQKREFEKNLEYYRKKYELSKSVEEMKKLKEAIEWTEKKIEELD